MRSAIALAMLVACGQPAAPERVEPAEVERHEAPHQAAPEEPAAAFPRLADDPIEEVVAVPGCVRRRSGRLQCWGGLQRYLYGDGFGLVRAPAVVPDLVGVAEVEAEDDFFCLRLESGEVRCRAGSLIDAHLEPTGVTDAAEIATANGVGCARRTSGAVACWRWDAQQALVPIAEIGGVGPVLEISASGPESRYRGRDRRAQICARRQSGEVLCWQVDPRDGAITAPAPMDLPEPAVAIAVASTFRCARHASRRLTCSGRVPREVGRWSDVDAIYANQTRACALRGEEVWCFDARSAAPVPELARPTSIATAEYAACAITGMDVRCWGESRVDNIYGAPVFEPQVTPVAIAALNVEIAEPPPRRTLRESESLEAVQISAGGETTCARRASGEVICWGTNYAGQLGDGSRRPSPYPVLATFVRDAVDIDVGSSAVCARRRGGAVVCWGDNTSGELGDGTTLDRRGPIEIAGVAGASDLAAGGCAIAIGDVVCWSRGFGGATPAAVGARGAIAIEVSSHLGHACALREDGRALCWGSSTCVPEGDEYAHPAFRAPRACPVFELPSGPLRALALGWSTTTCGAMRERGEVFCWRAGYGRPESSAPAPVSIGISGAVQIEAGMSFCARLENGDVRCWRDAEHLEPGPVIFRGADEIAVGAHHACARRGGDVFCWGQNADHQLGDGTLERTGRESPGPVHGEP